VTDRGNYPLDGGSRLTRVDERTRSQTILFWCKYLESHDDPQRVDLWPGTNGHVVIRRDDDGKVIARSVGGRPG
jgi:hypothetical protein